MWVLDIMGNICNRNFINKVRMILLYIGVGMYYKNVWNKFICKLTLKKGKIAGWKLSCFINNFTFNFSWTFLVQEDLIIIIFSICHPFLKTRSGNCNVLWMKISWFFFLESSVAFGAAQSWSSPDPKIMKNHKSKNIKTTQT